MGPRAAVSPATTLSSEPLRALIRDQLAIADALVLLESVPLVRLEREVRRLDRALLREHVVRSRVGLRLPGSASKEERQRAERLLADHRLFVTSLEQLHELNVVVATDGHGGNRQALGQYWKILLESID